MPVTVRVGAVHLGWDVVSVAAGGGGTPIRPVKVEGTYTPPAYLLADAAGRLHTAGAERQRRDLGMAIADVRDILGYPQIVVAGATWPAELVFHARMYHPLAAIGGYLRGKPDVVALPFPDGWPDEKVELYAELVEKLDIAVEPLPESVALSGYVRAIGLVRPPDERDPRGVGATGVYSDGRTMLVVAVHGDDEQPTESIEVPVTADAMRDAHSADNVVIEAMAAARSIGADTATVLLTGNVCFNEALRLAFQNHLGHRLQVAQHPMHALVLGATHLLVTEAAEAGPPAAPPYPPHQAPRPATAPGSPVVTYGPGYPTGAPVGEEPTTRVTRPDPSGGVPPHAAGPGSRFTRPPGHGDDQTTVLARPHAAQGTGAAGTVWSKMKDNFFGAPAVIGAVALAVVALPGDAGARPASGTEAAAVDRVVRTCGTTPRVEQQRQGIATVRDGTTTEPDCTQPNMDTLRYVVPGPPGAVDPGPPVEI